MMRSTAILLMVLAGEAAALQPGDHSRSVEVDGGERTYRALGTSTRDVSANDMMWEFFEQHPMK